MAADALVLKVREGGRVVGVRALIATGIDADGRPRDPRSAGHHLRGRRRLSSASSATWLLAASWGSSWSPPMRTPGFMAAAIGATLPGAAWQRCRTHYAANLMAITPKSSVGLGQGAAAQRL